MGWSNHLFLCIFSWVFLTFTCNAIQSSQKQVLLQLGKQLEYPDQLNSWFNTSSDLCYFSSNAANVTCQDNFVTELRIVGDKPSRVDNGFRGFAAPPQTLSGNFSMDSFVATLSRLTSLRILGLVSVGIWGPIPDKIHRLSSLEELDLSWNFLYGDIPASLSRIENLQRINFDGNHINGSFPNWISSISKLSTLSLKQNEISGKLPDLSGLKTLNLLILSENKLNSQLPKMPKNLQMLFLNKNSFCGEIPREYGELLALQQLDISFNSLKGFLPNSIFSLPNMTYLNLASNELTGILPTRLGCASRLGWVDLSDNKLTGPLPSCLSESSERRVVKYGGNCLSMVDSKDQHNETYCTESPAYEKASRRRNLGVLIGVIGGIFIVVAVLGSGFFVLCRKFCTRGMSEQRLLHKSVDNSVTGYPSEMLTNARFISEAAAAARMGTQGIPAHRLFPFDELREATNDFDRSTLVGEGSLGKLYKGRLANGTQVTIRRLTVSKKYTIRNLKLRLDLLARPRHVHLVCLLGHCIDGSEGRGTLNESGSNVVYLVYEYVPNGNYRSHLSGNSTHGVLKWTDRLSILIGVAKAVHFLHTGLIPGFFNNRLKANNILMNEQGMAKLSDYGLSILADDAENVHAKGEGTEPWLAKSLEDDVYSFGFILLESVIGASFAARKEEFLTNEMPSFGSQDGWRKKVDPIVLASSSPESLTVVVSIANKCFSADPSARPSFEDVLWHLQYAAQVQANATSDLKLEAI